MLYREEILDHFHHPQNFGRLKQPTHQAQVANSSCGDEMQFQFQVKQGKVRRVRFTGRGCAISMASASVLSEAIKDKSLEELAQLDLDDIQELIGQINPGRIKCALLPVEAIKQAILE